MKGVSPLLSVVLCCAPLVSGCEEATSARWDIRFASPADRDMTVAVAAQVLEGGCDGSPFTEQVLIREGFEGAGLPDPNLPADRYGFYAEGRDDECRIVARGCAEERLPGAARIETILEHEEGGEILCSSAQCQDGACIDAE